MMWSVNSCLNASVMVLDASVMGLPNRSAPDELCLAHSAVHSMMPKTLPSSRHAWQVLDKGSITHYIASQEIIQLPCICTCQDDAQSNPFAILSCAPERSYPEECLPCIHIDASPVDVWGFPRSQPGASTLLGRPLVRLLARIENRRSAELHEQRCINLNGCLGGSV